jgi:methyl-accepting chemotaxis protein
MRHLRNLPIAAKLTLASLAALVLLAALAGVVMVNIAAQRRLDTRAADATQAEREGRRAIAAMREAQLAGGRLQMAQTEAAVEDAAASFTWLADRTARELTQMKEAAVDDQARQEVERAEAALAAARKATSEMAAVRKRLLAARAAFLPLRARTDHAAQAFRASAAAADVTPDTRDALRQLERAYMDAAMHAREAAMLFLSTEDGELRVQMRDGDARARAAAAAADALALPDGVKQSAAALFAAGQAERQAAVALFDVAAQLGAIVSGPAEAARRSLDGALDAAVSAFADAARAARDQAEVGLVQARRHVLALAGGILLVLVLSGWLTARSIARPIAAMTRAVTRMAEGDTAVAVGFAGRRDEVGRMAAALEKLRAEVKQAFVMGQMIEQMPIGVMTADPRKDFRLSYANAAIRALLERMAAHLPVAPEAVVGSSIDLFHAAPGPVRAILADPAKLPHRARIRLGEATLDLLVTALRAPDGGYAGPMLVWNDVTRQAALEARFEQQVAAIAQAVGEAAAEMSHTAAAMRAAAAESGQRLDLVAGASQAATGHVQSVAASAEELAASVQEIGRQVAESARIAGAAVAEAEATDQSVAGLAGAAARIGDVVELIRGIAGRTNLLALNATIEAARAGEAGRGFAVVANEVKTLANQTAKATEEIGGQIAAMQAETTQAVAALRSIGATIRRMSEIATAIAGAVEEQSAATQEIARSVQEAAASTAQVDGTLGEVAGQVQHTGAQAEQVVTATGALGEQSATLSREVAGFLSALKAA